MGKVRCIKITTNSYENLQTKDDNALYFVNDSGTFSPESLEVACSVYLGDKLITKQAAQSIILQGGYKVMYNNQDVSNSENLGFIIASAKKNWYGTQSAYDSKVTAGTIQPNVAYHILVQPDWNEDDPSSLAYIKNKPSILDLDVQESSARFKYI